MTATICSQRRLEPLVELPHFRKHVMSELNAKFAEVWNGGGCEVGGGGGTLISIFCCVQQFSNHRLSGNDTIFYLFSREIHIPLSFWATRKSISEG